MHPSLQKERGGIRGRGDDHTQRSAEEQRHAPVGRRRVSPRQSLLLCASLRAPVSARSASSAFGVLLIALLGLHTSLIAQDLNLVDAAVAAQIEEARRAVRAAESDETLDRLVVADAHGRLGQVYHAYEFLDAASDSYERAIRLAPGDYRWPHLLAYVREQAGAFEQAVDLYREALRLEPSDGAAVLHLADVYLQLDRRDEARARFESVRGRYPASAMAGLGEVVLREHGYSDAIGLFEAALARAPYATRLHYSIGMALRGLGRLEEAQAALDQAGQGRVRAADPLVDALPGLLRGLQPLLNQARIEFEAGAYAAAAAMFRRALGVAPDSVDAHTGLAASLERLGDRAGALAELSWGDEGSVVALAIRLVDEQRFGDAVTLLTAAYGHFPDRDGTATTLARLLAASPDASLRNGSRALAIATEVYARRATPAHGETMALALAELGRCEEAAGWLQKAVAQAEREGDVGEARRLRAEAPRYERTPCR